MKENHTGKECKRNAEIYARVVVLMTVEIILGLTTLLENLLIFPAIARFN